MKFRSDGSFFIFFCSSRHTCTPGHEISFRQLILNLFSALHGTPARLFMKFRSDGSLFIFFCSSRHTCTPGHEISFRQLILNLFSALHGTPARLFMKFRSDGSFFTFFCSSRHTFTPLRIHSRPSCSLVTRPPLRCITFYRYAHLQWSLPSLSCQDHLVLTIFLRSRLSYNLFTDIQFFPHHRSQFYLLWNFLLLLSQVQFSLIQFC